MPDSQREIEKELSEQYDKNINKLNSLLYATYLILGYYSLIIINSKDIIVEIYHFGISSIYLSAISAILFDIWSLSILFALTLLLFQLIKIKKHKFEKNGEMIQIIEGLKLEKHNRKLYSSFDMQMKSYNLSIIFISCSIMSLFNFYIYSFCIYSFDESNLALCSIVIFNLIAIIITFIYCTCHSILIFIDPRKWFTPA